MSNISFTISEFLQPLKVPANLAITETIYICNQRDK